MRFRVVLELQDDGAYTAYVPSLPGCVSQGDTMDEATENVKEAIGLYIESINARGLPLPRVEEREVAV